MLSLFIVGAPGSGKTTLARALLPPEPYFIVKPKWTMGDIVCAVGHYTGGTFDGGDTIGYNGVKQALDYWRVHILNGTTLKVTLFDGDRFSYAGALETIRTHSASVGCVYLNADDATLATRRAGRGSHQNPTWMKGRVTKATRFFELFHPREKLALQADCTTTATMAQQVRQHFNVG